jgi:S1-C subfamily serine protease
VKKQKSLLLTAAFGLIINSLLPDPSAALSIPEIVAKAKPAILKIIAYDSGGKPLAFGTGFFISDDGALVTNRHVIEGAKTISAETLSGASYQCEGILIEPRNVDLAILKFKAKGVDRLSFATSSKGTEGGSLLPLSPRHTQVPLKPLPNSTR